MNSTDPDPSVLSGPGGDVKTPTIAPGLSYQPRDPRNYRPAIGLVGCGGITHYHLLAYARAGYNVAALCDIDLAKARARRDEFYPDAEIFDDYRDLLRRDDIEVVDVATHPPVRPPIVEAALRSGRHVLSQKPFVEDLDVGQRLVDLAARCGRRLAVNQNGRWAPHFAYIREAIAAGLLGRIGGVHLSVHWNHGWVAGTEFEKIKHLILYDFGIHWFDIVRGFLPGAEPRRVYASTARSATQKVRPPLLAQAMIEFDHAQASLAFDADTPVGPQDRTFVAGSAGSALSIGPGPKEQRVRLATNEGVAEPALEGTWFPDGFHGTMGELLLSIEENREPSNGAADNLKSLALCFAAVASAERGEPVAPGSVRRLPIDGNWQ
jgi:predicted dehydrogenase